jgi:hypothetical protein
MHQNGAPFGPVLLPAENGQESALHILRRRLGFRPAGLDQRVQLKPSCVTQDSPSFLRERKTRAPVIRSGDDRPKEPPQLSTRVHNTKDTRALDASVCMITSSERLREALPRARLAIANEQFICALGLKIIVFKHFASCIPSPNLTITPQVSKFGLRLTDLLRISRNNADCSVCREVKHIVICS